MQEWTPRGGHPPPATALIAAPAAADPNTVMTCCTSSRCNRSSGPVLMSPRLSTSGTAHRRLRGGFSLTQRHVPCCTKPQKALHGVAVIIRIPQPQTWPATTQPLTLRPSAPLRPPAGDGVACGGSPDPRRASVLAGASRFELLPWRMGLGASSPAPLLGGEAFLGGESLTLPPWAQPQRPDRCTWPSLSCSPRESLPEKWFHGTRCFLLVLPAAAQPQQPECCTCPSMCFSSASWHQRLDITDCTQYGPAVRVKNDPKQDRLAAHSAGGVGRRRQGAQRLGGGYGGRRGAARRVATCACGVMV